MAIAGILSNNSFWKNVEHILKVSESLVMILGLVDGEDKPTLGYQYEVMDRAKKIIQSRLKTKSEYSPCWQVIDRRWDGQLNSSLHAAAFFLNPQFYFDPNVSKQCREITKGLNDGIVRLIPDDETQDIIFKQCHDYKDSNCEFGSATAIHNRCKMSPGNRKFTIL